MLMAVCLRECTSHVEVHLPLRFVFAVIGQLLSVPIGHYPNTQDAGP